MMTPLRLTALLGCAAIAAGCGGGGGPAGADPAPPGGPMTSVALQAADRGRHSLELAAPSGRVVKYVIDVPPVLAKNAVGKPVLPISVVVLLHPAGKNKDHYGTGFMVHASSLGLMTVLAVAPDCLTGDDWADPVNAEHVEFLTRSVVRSYPVDPKRVVLVGLGAGGTGAWTIGPKCGDLFTGVVAVAGDPRDAAAAWPAGLPVCAVQYDTERQVVTTPDQAAARDATAHTATPDQAVAIGPARSAVKEIGRRGGKAYLFPVGPGFKPTDFTRYGTALWDAGSWMQNVAWK